MCNNRDGTGAIISYIIGVFGGLMDMDELFSNCEAGGWHDNIDVADRSDVDLFLAIDGNGIGRGDIRVYEARFYFGRLDPVFFEPREMVMEVVFSRSPRLLHKITIKSHNNKIELNRKEINEVIPERIKHSILVNAIALISDRR